MLAAKDLSIDEQFVEGTHKQRSSEIMTSRWTRVRRNGRTWRVAARVHVNGACPFLAMRRVPHGERYDVAYLGDAAHLD
jgi:hypothetical protein